MGHKSVTNDAGTDEMNEQRARCTTIFTRPKKYGTKIGETRQIVEGLVRFEQRIFSNICYSKRIYLVVNFGS